MRKNKIKQRSRTQRVLLAGMILMMIGIVYQPAQAQTQWATAPNGTDISNANSGNVGIGTTAPAAKLQITNQASGAVGQIIVGAPSQTANLFQTQDAAGNINFRIKPDGNPSWVVPGYGINTVPYATFNPTLGWDGANRGWGDPNVHLIARGIGNGYFPKHNIEFNSYSTTVNTTFGATFVMQNPAGGFGYAPAVVTQIKGTDNQTGDLTQWVNSAGALLANVTATGGANFGGNVGVTGNLNTTGVITGGNIVAKYQDIAEWVPTSKVMPAGTVVVLDSLHSNYVISSSKSYDTKVAGVISAQPGIALGESGANKVLVATTGRVKVKVDATRAPIQIGDLLVTSGRAGLAMKSEPLMISGREFHSPGTLIGKALEPLDKGTGEILVLLSLQ